MVKLVDEGRLRRFQQAFVGLDSKSPIGDDTDRAAGKMEREMMACRQFAASLVERVRSRNVSISEELLERPKTRLRFERRMADERGKFARESKEIVPRSCLGVVHTSFFRP
jgi:hypothetical protein